MSRNPYSLFLERFGRFTEIQEGAFPIIEAGSNCLIIAPTGSGKTEAALLPVLDRISKSGKKGGILAVYITPLKALNRDLLRRMEWLCDALGITMGVRHGDTTAAERGRQAREPPQLIITTPETLQNMLLSYRLRDALRNIKVAIVDELHELYYNKRGAQLSVGLERLEELSGGFQRIGISGTIGNVEEASVFLCGGRNCRIVKSSKGKEFRISIEMPLLPEREHRELQYTFGIDDSAMARLERIDDLIRVSNATLVFANTRQAVETLGSKLIYLDRLEGVETIGIHHGSLDKAERIDIENRFREGELRSIVATSSLELGIDIGRIDFVIQYGSPRQVARLLQRIGRGGHREGISSDGCIIVSGVLDALESAAVIISAKNGEMERLRVESNALDVLANQICSVVLEYRKISIEKLYAMIRRSAPYLNLERVKFDRVLEFAAEEHLIKIENGNACISSRSRDYFINNISVIPDSPRFYVKEAVRNRVISTLDGRFVYSYIDEGSSFITKGLPWKVISVEENVIFVEPSKEFEAAVPDWEGEDIPVSHRIAEMAFGLLGKKEAVEEISDMETYKTISEFVEKQSRFFMPSEGKLFVEELEDYIIIYLTLGKLANEFVSRLVGGILSADFGDTVKMRSTPYAVIIDCMWARRRPDLRNVFNIMCNSCVLSISDKFVGQSELFRYKFVQTAKLFGVVEKKAAIRKSDAKKIMAFYKDSVVYEEVLRDLEKNYLDIETVKNFVGKLREKKISIEVLKFTDSPLSAEVMKSVLRYKELLSVINPGDEEVENFEGRFKSKSVMLFCTYCGFVFSKGVEADGERELVCLSCRSPMLSIYEEGYDEIFAKRRAGRRLSKKEAGVYEVMIKEAGLIDAYKDRAIIALLTYGVGLTTATRLLRMVRKDKRSFITDLIHAQKLFIKNGRFWKSKT